MTNEQFKAWFEGYTEEMKGTPAKSQWKKIQAKVTEISGATLWRYPSYSPYFVYSTYTGGSPNYTGTITCNNTEDASNMMYTVGKAEFNAESSQTI